MLPCVYHIKIANSFPLSNLVSRQVANDLFALLADRHQATVEVDFAGIDTVSRAFADQFHKLKIQVCEERGVMVMPFNLAPEVLSMLQAVATTQGAFGREYKATPVFHLHNRRELRDFLFAF